MTDPTSPTNDAAEPRRPSRLDGMVRGMASSDSAAYQSQGVVWFHPPPTVPRHLIDQGGAQEPLAF